MTEISQEIAREMLAVLREIERDRDQYNFGSKLRRIIAPVLKKAEGLNEAEEQVLASSRANPGEQT